MQIYITWVPSVTFPKQLDFSLCKMLIAPSDTRLEKPYFEPPESSNCSEVMFT